jgi:muconolactone delta-isomerase
MSVLSNKKRTNRFQMESAANPEQTAIQAIERLKTREQFAEELNICSRTMKKYLKTAGFKLPKGLIKVADQERIRQIVLGIPINSNGFQTIPINSNSDGCVGMG